MSAAGQVPRGANQFLERPLASRLANAGLDWIVPDWPTPRFVHALMTTRNGGVSTGARASLDLGNPAASGATRADADAIVENRRRLRAFLPSDPIWLEQSHGVDVATVTRAEREREAAPLRADAAVTREAEAVLAVRVADCLPVLLAERSGVVIGVAHAGWRGLAAGVLENAVAAMECDPASVVAWLGPAIGRTAFEVGDDVRDAFVDRDRATAVAFAPGRSGKWHADLRALARMRLARAGVASMHGDDACTLCEPARFFSFRRDRTAGRMAALLWIERSAS